MLNRNKPTIEHKSQHCYNSFLTSSTGTTWTQEIVWQIHNEGKVSKENIGRRVPFLEFATVEYTTKPDFESLQRPRLIKSHLTADIIPKGSDKSSRCKYIYVSRNPKDVCVSMFFYLKSMAEADTIKENAYNGPLEFFVNLFIQGDGRCDYYWDAKYFYITIGFGFNVQ